MGNTISTAADGISIGAELLLITIGLELTGATELELGATDDELSTTSDDELSTELELGATEDDDTGALDEDTGPWQ